MGRVVLSQALILQAPLKTPDAAGGGITLWEERGLIWAQMRAQTARLREEQVQNLALQRWEVVVRGLAFDHPMRPKPGHRLRQATRYWWVESVAEVGPRGRWLRCLCVEEEVIE